MAAAWTRRRAGDISMLTKNGFDVSYDGEPNLECFLVKLKGPKDTPYFGFEWDIRFTLPKEYPFKSPSVGFVQHIYHPNIDERSGSVCLDSLNSQWSPGFTLLSIVELHLPYLLTYPNPDDPFNKDAAVLLKTRPEQFKKTANEHANNHAIRVSIQVPLQEPTQEQSSQGQGE